MKYTLYATPGACSINPQIVLRELDLPFEIVTVNLATKKLANGDDYLKINPKGYVPALQISDGQILTENIVMTLYLADQNPESGLAPAPDATDRFSFLEKLVFITTELHKGMSPLYNPTMNAEFRTSLLERLGLRFQHLDDLLGEDDYLHNQRFSIADAYAFYTLRSWQHVHGGTLSPNLKRYYDGLATRPTVQASLEADGLKA